MKAKIRKTQVIVETTYTDLGRKVKVPTRKAAALAVIENPFAGKFTQKLDALMEIGEELGGTLGQMCVDALGIDPSEAQSYGKAAIVGENGVSHPAQLIEALQEHGVMRPTSEDERAAYEAMIERTYF